MNDPRTYFYFYAPEQDKAKLEQLRDAYKDFDADLKWIEETKKWSLVLKKEYDFSAVNMQELDESFMPVGEKFGVVYDGYDRPVAQTTSAPKPQTKKGIFGFLNRNKK